MTKPILLAEDCPDDATLLQLTLKKAGVDNRVFVVADGDEAISYLNGDGRFADRIQYPFPGVLLLDLRMPRKDGFEVLQWCQAQAWSEQVLRVVLSGHDELWRIRHAYLMGARSFLVKPCDPIEISNLVNAFPEFWEEQSGRLLSS